MNELLISDNKKVYQPAVEGEIEWTTERKGVPGKLTFKIFDDGFVDYSEGNSVSFKFDGKKVFYGFIFTVKVDNDNIVSITAYDQLRYLKNKDTYVYKKKTAAQVLKMIASDFRLRIGKVRDTKFYVMRRIEENKTLFDIIQNALDLTLDNRKKMYVLYDDFGKLNLQDVDDLKLNIQIDAGTSSDLDYSTSIDGETYNRIKLTYENEKTGKRDVYIAQDSKNINQWGVLQYYDTVDDPNGAKTKVNALLKLYNKKTKNLSVKKAFGDIRARAGYSVVVSLEIGKEKFTKYMLIEKAKHVFGENEYYMDLTLRGGDFSA